MAGAVAACTVIGTRPRAGNAGRAVCDKRLALLAPPHNVAGHRTARGMSLTWMGAPILAIFLFFLGNSFHFFVFLFILLLSRRGAGSAQTAQSNGRRTRHVAPPSKAAARGRRAGCGAEQCRWQTNLVGFAAPSEANCTNKSDSVLRAGLGGASSSAGIDS